MTNERGPEDLRLNRVPNDADNRPPPGFKSHSIPDEEDLAVTNAADVGLGGPDTTQRILPFMEGDNVLSGAGRGSGFMMDENGNPISWASQGADSGSTLLDFGNAGRLQDGLAADPTIPDLDGLDDSVEDLDAID
jgi:hypothetical protein